MTQRCGCLWAIGLQYRHNDQATPRNGSFEGVAGPFAPSAWRERNGWKPCPGVNPLLACNLLISECRGDEPVQRRRNMLSWALMFLIVAIIAGVLGFSGIAGTASQIAWILFVVGLIVALVFFVMGRRPRV